MTTQTAATSAIEYHDGVVDLFDGEQLLDTITPREGESRRDLLARHGLMASVGAENWIDTEHGKASEFGVEPVA